MCAPAGAPRGEAAALLNDDNDTRRRPHCPFALRSAAPAAKPIARIIVQAAVATLLVVCGAFSHSALECNFELTRLAHAALRALHYTSNRSCHRASAIGAGNRLLPARYIAAKPEASDRL